MNIVLDVNIMFQCAELLSYMGVTSITAPGEAEAFCAHLNKQGVHYFAYKIKTDIIY